MPCFNKMATKIIPCLCEVLQMALIDRVERAEMVEQLVMVLNAFQKRMGFE